MTISKKLKNFFFFVLLVVILLLFYFIPPLALICLFIFPLLPLFKYIMNLANEYKNNNELLDTATSKAQSVSMGEVVIKGKVSKNSHCIVSPLTGEKCVYYKYTYGGKSQGQGSVPFYSKTDNTGFLIEDKSGEVFVSSNGFNYKIKKHRVKLEEGSFEFNKLFGGLPEDMVKSQKIFGGFGFYSEEIIRPGDEIIVNGDATNYNKVTSIIAGKGGIITNRSYGWFKIIRSFQLVRLIFLYTALLMIVLAIMMAVWAALFVLGVVG